MFFSLGIETPINSETAYGIVIPALCNDEYSCFSAADSMADIPAMATEAILLVVEEMIKSGQYDIHELIDDPLSYQRDEQYSHCDTWLLIYVDLSKFTGKQKRINITLPDLLIDRIDNLVKSPNSLYKDRSAFLAEAARHELAQFQSKK